MSSCQALCDHLFVKMGSTNTNTGFRTVGLQQTSRTEEYYGIVVWFYGAFSFFPALMLSTLGAYEPLVPQSLHQHEGESTTTTLNDSFFGGLFL